MVDIKLNLNQMSRNNESHSIHTNGPKVLTLFHTIRMEVRHIRLVLSKELNEHLLIV